jgi:hypothetical protein
MCTFSWVDVVYVVQLHALLQWYDVCHDFCLKIMIGLLFILKQVIFYLCFFNIYMYLRMLVSNIMMFMSNDVRVVYK